VNDINLSFQINKKESLKKEEKEASSPAGRAELVRIRDCKKFGISITHRLRRESAFL